MSLAEFFWILVSGELDEEDSCPPDLESVDVVQQQVDYQQQQQQRTTTQQTSLDQVLFEPDSELLRNLAIAIKVRSLFSYCILDKYYLLLHKFFRN